MLTRRLLIQASQYTTCRTIASTTRCPKQLLSTRCSLAVHLTQNLTQRTFGRSLFTAAQSGFKAPLSNSSPLVQNVWRLSPLVTISQHQSKRTITVVSRLGKRKTCKSVLKRFRRVKGGYLKRWRSGMVKKQRKKSSWRKFRLRGSILVKRPSQLRTLNKMMYKY
eukprot:TCONS_00019180-protein